MDESGFVFEDTPELREALDQVDAQRVQILEGVARRLGEDASLKEAIAFYQGPGPEPPKRSGRKK